MHRAALIRELISIIGPEGVISEPEQLVTYESDGLRNHRVLPMLVVLPVSTEQVQAVMRLCHAEGIPVVPRGSGTGLSAGALPVSDGIVLGLSRMREILEVDLDNARARVQPGVLNLWITQRVAPDGYYFAPDPSSQQVCSIGGNVAENSGGAHCLKYGFTVNHVLGLTVVLADGQVVKLGGKGVDKPGYDLVGVLVGSEGTLCVVTEVTVRLVRKPEAVSTLQAAFASPDAAGTAVSDIIGAGIVPAAIEMMDNLSIQAAEAAVHANYPLDAGAILLVELDGPSVEVAEQMALVLAISERNAATAIKLAANEDERVLMWKGRKSAFAAMGRISRDYYVQDGVIPRTALPTVLREIGALAERYGLRVANVFHAGDGNLHPLVLFDSTQEGETERAEALAGDILHVCVDAGGSITGEHGVGLDKKRHMPAMFAPADLDTMQLLRCAIDPTRTLNPDKIFPTPRLCGERPGLYKPHPLQEAGLADLF
ncbi:MAG TPA: FAD-linked oxidase C-terminal domain-containing protein [Chloroflexia bacterium]|nr:FAD-linked oxidase C-terminal domain-containing protein [Chloroflexia bacterium]